MQKRGSVYASTVSKTVHFPITKFMKDNKLMADLQVCPKCAHDEYSSPYYLKCKYCESTMVQTDFSEESI